MLKNVVRRIGVVLALLAVLASYGGHWGVLQTVAWSGMMYNYSRAVGFTEGIKQTFDGEHPCSLCTRISQARGDAEPASELGIATPQPPLRHFTTPVERVIPPVANYVASFASAQTVPEPPLELPPTPPPRVRA